MGTAHFSTNSSFFFLRLNQNLPAILKICRPAAPPTPVRDALWHNDQRPTQNSTLKTQNSAFGDQTPLSQNPHPKTPPRPCRTQPAID